MLFMFCTEYLKLNINEGSVSSKDKVIAVTQRKVPEIVNLFGNN